MPSPFHIELSGPGLHDGIPACLTLSLRSGSQPSAGPESTGPFPAGLLFFLPGEGALSLEELGAMAREAPRSTLLRRPMAKPPEAGPSGFTSQDAGAPGAGAILKTPEHLLASLLFFSGLPLDIGCDA